jgi:perosamine synthetase
MLVERNELREGFMKALQKAEVERRYRYPLARPILGERERKYLLEAYDSGWISSRGKFIPEFESKFASYVGTNFGVATSNGTTALHLALTALGISKGDEVIVPDLTFVSPANAVSYTGARPTFADSNREYWGVDEQTIRKRVSAKTKAIIVVHLYGHPVDLDPIMELCESRSLTLIEDCAEAHGAEYRHKKVGGFGKISCFSFYGNKMLTTGEGGMCLTQSEALADRMRMLRDHGAQRTRHFWHPIIGFNYRMTNLQAAIGCAQLETLRQRLEQYIRIGHEYTRRLSKSERFVTHPEADWARCIFWMYTILVKGLTPKTRDALTQRLADKGIETRPMFPPVSRFPPYVKYRQGNPVAASLSRRGLSLPTYPELTIDDVEVICSSLQKSVS